MDTDKVRELTRIARIAELGLEFVKTREIPVVPQQAKASTTRNGFALMPP